MMEVNMTSTRFPECFTKTSSRTTAGVDLPAEAVRRRTKIAGWLAVSDGEDGRAGDDERVSPPSAIP
jgi:hypothetical protein